MKTTIRKNFINLLFLVLTSSHLISPCSGVSTTTTSGAVPRITIMKPYQCVDQIKCYSAKYREVLDCRDRWLTCIPVLSENDVLPNFDYAKNRIENLPTNVFKQQIHDSYVLSKVKTLDLGFNRLTLIEEGAFNGLNSLESVCLESNRLKSVPTLSFQGLKQLKKLNLKNNELDSILPAAFKPLVNLEELELSHCQLHTIEAEGFTGLVNLQTLDLAGNNFDTLAKRVLEGMSRLRQVKLTGNAGNLKLADLNWMDVFGYSTLASYLGTNEQEEEEGSDYDEYLEPIIRKHTQKRQEVPCNCKKLRKTESDKNKELNSIICSTIWKFFKANMSLECIGKPAAAATQEYQFSIIGGTGENTNKKAAAESSSALMRLDKLEVVEDPDPKETESIFTTIGSTIMSSEVLKALIMFIQFVLMAITASLFSA